MKKTTNIITKIFTILLLIVVCTTSAYAYTLVLDPGHGGKDPGAVGKYTYEKDLNLRLAHMIEQQVKKQYPEVKVILTREDDTFMPLQKRADVANKNKADLFISIHANSSESKEPHGVETFILGTDNMEKNLDVAMRENAVMKLETDYKTTYQGFDPNSIDSYIMFELMQNNFMDQSLHFATLVQQQCVQQLKRYDRGVRQAAFWVLLKTACPSILFEMGFVSNPEEEQFLSDTTQLRRMAQSITEAFAFYAKKHIDKRPITSSTISSTNSQRTSSKGAKRPPTKYYAIQICASRELLDLNDPRFKQVECDYIRMGEWYKYYTSPSTSRSKVEKKLQELKKLFPDCWIISFKK